ncbi:hypothetical protein FOZ60_014700 [Perkinsus olseni]|uniref:Uncharacterized protein n=1 Tax=Perkinsus olseni TaxID=32597 RepID=A0A7J6PLB0_PEROL|nr:hypothetical protein FOZ60_014700 [Perkinsus olseni]
MGLAHAAWRRVLSRQRYYWLCSPDSRGLVEACANEFKKVNILRTVVRNRGAPRNTRLYSRYLGLNYLAGLHGEPLGITMSTSEGSRPAKRSRKSSSYPSIALYFRTRSAPSSSSPAVTGGGRVQEGTEPSPPAEEGLPSDQDESIVASTSQVKADFGDRILEAVNVPNPDDLPRRPASGKPADVKQSDWICRVLNGPHAGYYCRVCIYICHQYSWPLVGASGGAWVTKPVAISDVKKLKKKATKHANSDAHFRACTRVWEDQKFNLGRGILSSLAEVLMGKIVTPTDTSAVKAPRFEAYSLFKY